MLAIMPLLEWSFLGLFSVNRVLLKITALFDGFFYVVLGSLETASKFEENGVSRKWLALFVRVLQPID